MADPTQSEKAKAAAKRAAIKKLESTSIADLKARGQFKGESGLVAGPGALAKGASLIAKLAPKATAKRAALKDITGSIRRGNQSIGIDKGMQTYEGTHSFSRRGPFNTHDAANVEVRSAVKKAGEAGVKDKKVDKVVKKAQSKADRDQWYGFQKGYEARTGLDLNNPFRTR